MTRIRSANKGLPHRVYIKSGAYRYLSAEKMIDPADGVAKNWIGLCPVSEGESAMYLALMNLKFSIKHQWPGYVQNLKHINSIDILKKYRASIKASAKQ